MLWCQGVQNIGLSNHKLISALTCTVSWQCTPVPDRQTDRQTNIMAIAWRFVLRKTSHTQNDCQIDTVSTINIIHFFPANQTLFTVLFATECKCTQLQKSKVH